MTTAPSKFPQVGKFEMFSREFWIKSVDGADFSRTKVGVYDMVQKGAIISTNHKVSPLK